MKKRNWKKRAAAGAVATAAGTGLLMAGTLVQDPLPGTGVLPR